jgi:hypothetical protein
MSNISMTTLLGVAAVLGPVMLAVLAQSEDRAMATKQCVGEKCPITSKATGKKALSTKQARKSGDSQKTVNEKSKSVQAMVSVQPNRISCGDGRAIVAKRFNSVRVGECKGGTYTYFGLRKGATFRILVDRSTGRIIARAPL